MRIEIACRRIHALIVAANIADYPAKSRRNLRCELVKRVCGVDLGLMYQDAINEWERTDDAQLWEGI
jgi:hypothetical protein